MKKFRASTDGRPTVAFMTRDIDGVTGYTLFQSAVESARANSCNIVVFSGYQIGHSKYNSVYKFCNPDLFEGFLNWATSEEKDIAHYRYLADAKLVSLTMQIPGHPFVTIDCHTGTREAILHLIRAHKKQKIAFVRGPQNHIYAAERYKAYLEALAESGISLDERLITPEGDYTFNAGVSAINCLEAQRGLKAGMDYDAVVTTNDRTLMGVASELQKTGIKIPQDLAALSLNSTIEGASFNPPLSSVSMPFHNQLRTGLEKLLRLMRNESVEESTALVARPVIKKSCGCQTREIIFAETAGIAGPGEKTPSGRLSGKKVKNTGITDFGEHCEEAAGLILPRLASDEVLGTAETDVQKALVIKLVTSFHNALSSGLKTAFLTCFEESLVFLSENNCNIQPWHNALSSLPSTCGVLLDDPAKLVLANRLLSQARIIISEVLQRKNISEQNFQNNARQLLQKTNMKLVSSFNLESLLAQLALGVKALGIPSYYVCLYDHPVEYCFPESLPEYSRLVFALNPKKQVINPAGERFATMALLPDDVIDRQNRFDLVVIPLVFADRQLGYTIAEMGPVAANFYTTIADQLACALEGSNLMEERKNTETALETTLENLQNKATVVSENSRSIMDRVTMISAATEEIAANIRQISRETEEVLNTVKVATSKVGDTIAVIKALREQSDRISQITSLINDIAEKTNILSLNANIEAARAGESGRGFKVVASEIKKLSQITVTATNEISGIVATIRESGQETFDSVSGVISVIERISDLSAHIREAVAQQSKAANEVADSLTRTASGSRMIFEAISEVSVADDSGESRPAGETISDRLRKLKSRAHQ